MADQAVSSLSNATLTIIIASHVSTEDYGAFALAFALYGFASSLVQAIAGQVLLVHFAGASSTEHRAGARQATGSALVISLFGSFAFLTGWFFLETPLSNILLAFAILLPGLLVQDTWRSVFVSRGTPAAALWNDLIWLFFQAVGVGALLIAHSTSVISYTLVWGLSGLLAACFGGLQTRSIPAPQHTKQWLLGHKEVSVPSLANSLAVIGAAQLAFVVIAAIGGLDDVAALRACQTLLGPLNIIGFAAASFSVPEVARRNLTGRALRRVALLLSGVLIGADLLWGAALLLIPEAWGRFLLGETWDGAREVLPWMVAFTCLIAATSGSTGMVRAWNWATFAFWTSAVLGPAMLVFSAIGTYLYGVRGAAIGFASAAALTVPLAWYFLEKVIVAGRRVRENIEV